jgi:hypothetical protein
VVGIIYLASASAIALAYFIRDEIERWLDHCRYGNKYNELNWTLEQEYLLQQLLVNTPYVYA